jgi:large subunit ribosomal protein L13
VTTKTYAPRPRDIDRRWYVVDAQGAVLGRLASEVAKLLRGKHKPMFAQHMDTGDHVIVVNARAVRLTGGKEVTKVAYRHSGYPGGIREISYAKLLSERPATAVEKAIRGMLPKNRLGRSMLKKLSVYEGPEHPHQAQKPKPLGVGEIPKWEGLPPPAPAPAAKPRAAARSRKGPTTRAEATPSKRAPAARAGATADAAKPPRKKASSTTTKGGESGSARRRSARAPRSSRTNKES